MKRRKIKLALRSRLSHSNYRITPTVKTRKHCSIEPANIKPYDITLMTGNSETTETNKGDEKK